METKQNQNSRAYQPTGSLKQMENFFDTYLHKKVPFHLPPNIKEIIVKFGPWIILISMLFALPVILLALGLRTAYGPVMMGYGGIGYHRWFFLAGLFSIVAFVMEGIALPGLFARKLSGWRLIYYAVLVSALGQLLGWQIINAIISVIISMYFLFEIKEYYK